MRGEVGGPLTRSIYKLLPVLPTGRINRLIVGWLGPVILAYGILALGDTALGWPWGEQIAVAVVCMAAGIAGGVAAYALALKSTRDRVLRVLGGWGWKDLWWAGALIITLPTVGFAVLTAILGAHKILGVKGVKASDPSLTIKTFEAFAWSLADSVPILKIPDTLHWKPKLSFTTIGGAIVLLYKLLLVVPFVQLAALAISGTFGERNAEPPVADGEASQADPGQIGHTTA
jgi:hypothetical protein